MQGVTVRWVLVLLGLVAVDCLLGRQARLDPLYAVLLAWITWNANWRQALAAIGGIAGGAALKAVIIADPTLPIWAVVLDVIGTALVQSLLVGAICRWRAALDRETENARTDDLTQLPNRRGFGEALERDLLRRQRSRKPLAVALIDIDGVREVNETEGHSAGDDLLRQIALGLSAAIRRTDTCGRLDGTTFAACLPDCDPEAARVVMGKLEGALGHALADRPQPVAHAIGLVVSAEPGLDRDRLMDAAAEALQVARMPGSGGAHLTLLVPVT